MVDPFKASLDRPQRSRANVCAKQHRPSPTRLCPGTRLTEPVSHAEWRIGAVVGVVCHRWGVVLRSVGGASPWSALTAPPGMALLEHVRRKLPASGRGPLPDAVQSLPIVRGSGGLPYFPDSVVESLAAVGRVRDAPNGDVAWVAGAVLRALDTPSQANLDAALARLADLRSPATVDAFLAAVGHASRARRAGFARWVCENGTDRSMVKAGLAMLGTSGTPADSTLIVTLGLLESLTLYAAVALTNLLPDPEKALFDLAQQADGWGRIHCLQRLRRTGSPEIQDWMLRGGYNNGVMVEEVAWLVATTGRLREALDQPTIDDDLFAHAGVLLAALANGGPAEDMSDYPPAAHVLTRYAEIAETRRLTVNDLDNLSTLRNYCQSDASPSLDGETALTLAGRLQALVTGDRARAEISRCLQGPDWRDFQIAFGLAPQVGLDALPPAWRWVGHKPDVWLWQEIVRRHADDDLEQVLDKARGLLIPSQPDDRPSQPPQLFYGAEYAADECLGQVLEALRDRPGVGHDILLAGLRSPIPANRSLAVQAYRRWPHALPDGTRMTLQAMQWNEPVPGVRSAIRALLGLTAPSGA